MLTRYCVLVILFTVVHHCAGDKEAVKAYGEWLDTVNPFQRKFSFEELSTTAPFDVGYLGSIKTVATEAIKAREVVYTYPVALAFEPAPKIENEDKLAPHQRNMLHLIYLLNKRNSEWAPYLNVIPTTFSTPIFWSLREIEELSGTSIYGSSIRQNNSLMQEHEDIFEELDITKLYPDADSAVFTPHAWRWAYTVLRNRAWRVRDENKLLPIFEIFNYAHKANVEVTMKDDVLQFVATESIAKGEPLFINDGIVGNRELLEWYGFVIPSNSHDYYPVGVGLDDSDKLYGFKRNLFRQAEIENGETFQLQRSYIPPKLLLALRIYHVTIYDHSEAQEALMGRMISAQNELSVCETIMELCESTLETLKHTLKADSELLERLEGKGPSNLYSAAMIRRTEKSILKSIMKLAKMRLEDVKRDWQFRSMDIPTIRGEYAS